MKKRQLLFLLFMFSINSYGQVSLKDFKTIQVNKKIRDFADQFDLSSPLKSCITFNYLTINGKERLKQEASTIRFKDEMPDPNTPDVKVSEEVKNLFLNFTIKEIMTYRDSVAGVIIERKKDYYQMRIFNLENGKWVNAGENPFRSMGESRLDFLKRADQLLNPY